jgi:putative ABC transport system permease protein
MAVGVSTIGGLETLRLSLQAVWTHKFRSGLTILGIVIGITTVVTVASLLSGLRKGITDFFEEFGPDNLFIARFSGDPSGQNAPQKELKRRPLDPSYVDYLKQTCRNIQDVSVAMIVIPRGRLLTAKVAGFETENIQLVGNSANAPNITPREIRVGRYFTPDEAARGQRVAVLGSAAAEALFPDGSGVGRTVMIDGSEYTVIGIYTPMKGSFFGENPADQQIHVPLQVTKVRYPNSDIYWFNAKALPGHRADAIEEVRAALRRIRHVPAGVDDDFSITTADSIIENFDKITGMVVLMSLAISGLGLLVGGIGVMNIMLVSVTERTREIGVRKALGARRRDIVVQFLTEAVALTGVGGIVGVLFSVMVTLLIGLVLPKLPSAVPMWAVVTGFTVSVAIGVFFGVWPAVKASRLDPVEALRYE